MIELLSKIKGKIIVSAQASKVDPVHEGDCLISIVKSVIKGGASALRLAGEGDIKKVRSFSDIPIIGITKPDPLPKNWKEVVYITPGYTDAVRLAEAGADIIALDGTARKRPDENLEELINNIRHGLKKPVMADVSTLKEGIDCNNHGVDIVSTTLSGYTSYTLDKDNGEPDFELLKKLTKSLDCPVILEGRIWTIEHVRKAFELGAHAVVIGSAITRPEVITRRFVKEI